MEDDRYTRITLRIPKDLHAALTAEADATSKSLNAEIVGRLAASFERPDPSTLPMVGKIGDEPTIFDEIMQAAEDAKRLREELAMAKTAAVELAVQNKQTSEALAAFYDVLTGTVDTDALEEKGASLARASRVLQQFLSAKNSGEISVDVFREIQALLRERRAGKSVLGAVESLSKRSTGEGRTAPERSKRNIRVRKDEKQ
jgi:hypothetical protein